MQAYRFTLPPILSALAPAKERGVDVAVILDKSNDRSGEKSRYSVATFVARAGIPVFIDCRPAIAHNKIIIIDHHLVISGSYNFTPSAERRSAENVTLHRFNRGRKPVLVELERATGCVEGVC